MQNTTRPTPALSVYQYKDYKKFVHAWINQAPHEGRGFRKALAEAIGCQTPFITHVLSGNYHFSLEQAEAGARWMGLSEPDIEFFILLVMHQRAGTKNLEKLLAKQLSARRDQHAVLKERVEINDTLGPAEQATYYSNWQYAAIHLALLNPELQTLDNLQRFFQIPLSRLLNLLEFLLSCGLIKKEKNSYKVLRPMLHLDLHSPLLRQHHTNWRLRSIDALSAADASNLHYSGVLSLSKDDYEWVRDRLSAFLEETANRVRDSKDEKLAALTFDWFAI